MSLIFKSFVIDNVSWTGLYVDVDCNNVTLEVSGANAVKLRSDPNVASTEKARQLAVNDQYTLNPATRQPYLTRFRAGVIFVYAQAAAGTATIGVSALL